MSNDVYRQAAENMMPEFTPAEAATITGVSVDLQRDWRRRGYLGSRSDGKHNRYRIRDICLMFAFKAFSDAGLGPRILNAPLDVRNADTAARTAVTVMEDFINDGSIVQRYVIVDGRGLLRVSSLDEYQKYRDSLGNIGSISIIFDCKNAVHEIMSNMIDMENNIEKYDHFNNLIIKNN